VNVLVVSWRELIPDPDDLGFLCEDVNLLSLLG
jgi:hypothetical protein